MFYMCLERVFGVGLEMLQNGSWKRPGASFRRRLGNPSKWLPGSLLERVFGVRLEMFQNAFLETSWREFSASAWKCLKMPSWKPPGASFQRRPGNGSKWLPGLSFRHRPGNGSKWLPECQAVAVCEVSMKWHFLSPSSVSSPPSFFSRKTRTTKFNNFRCLGSRAGIIYIYMYTIKPTFG